jgi:hypothetical protein
MKAFQIGLGTFVLTVVIASTSLAQQQFIHTVTAQDPYCNSTRTLLNVPENIPADLAGSNVAPRS